ncbi:MAG: ATP synthase F0 subunit B [Pyrinomonadaceae bacterium]|nr:ATP synthase F0 subunit B [Pyrinomonadaceae bacterium]
MILLAFQEVRLVPDGTIFIHIALILIMIWVLNRTFFRPVNRVLEARAKKTGGRSSEAQELLKSVGEKQLRYDEAMREARGEGYELIERERANAVAERQAKVGAVKEEVAEFAAQENQELNRQTSEARNAIAADAERMAERISAAILK